MHAKHPGTPSYTRTGNLISPVETRRQNTVLRRLIEHVRSFSPETGDGYEPLEEISTDEPEQPIAHRRPHIERGQLE